ncbi:ADP-ribosylglycohydrolase family protein [Kribbella pratensis]|uniref:ADP-ribosylglycohydrolase n=1 Tax=Kribbella pratensis TaxID=2512112 RepID=A0A4R8CP87_9ACTN|nr:ADP-ribosylglycohydrolase family protein [Kribbella pratensis]TDW77970.1 ADP-ribosylglycohydrolase [Kribbella pratensis]
MRMTWVQPEDLLPHQLVQARSEGVDVTDVQARWLAAGGTTDAPVSGASADPAPPALRALARELLDVLDARTAAWHEPEIPDLPSLGEAVDLEARTLNAWLGRCAGNLLGKPVEKIPREGIREILAASGQWPLTQYITAVGVPDDVQQRWPWNRRSKVNSLREVINGMPEDDDINFAILALLMLERHGRGLTTEDVALSWLNELPAGRVFTAERVAYRNLLEGVDPARAAVVGNPFREWIGAQIRTDAYGWANPGDRTAAARLALVDARLSHTGAGVDGALWVAAMSAAALVLDDPVRAAVAGLEVVNGQGAIARAVRFGLTLADAELDDALDALHAEYGDLHWVHAVNNTALTAYALTAPDFTTAIGRAVMGGWDTDSAGATVGAVFGATRGVPAEWSTPLDNRVTTSLPGMNQIAIDELAARTVEVSRGAV